MMLLYGTDPVSIKYMENVAVNTVNNRIYNADNRKFFTLIT